MVFIFAVFSMLLTAYSTTLVQDKVAQTHTPMSHCSLSTSVDDSSVAFQPAPFGAFVVPHADLNEIKPDQHLSNCAAPEKLVNRKAESNNTSCVPADSSHTITLGNWQWCPEKVSWKEDVRQATPENNQVEK